MRIDSQWVFVPPSAPLSLVGAGGATFNSTVIDLLGQGVGTAPQAIIGNVTVFGADLGIMDGPAKPKLQVTTGPVNFASAGACTANLAFQLAPDLGAGGAYQPGAWQTAVETGAMTVAQLLASSVIARLDWPPVFPKTLRPRYARLSIATPAGLSFTAGSINFAGVTWMRDDYAVNQAANNYKVQ